MVLSMIRSASPVRSHNHPATSHVSLRWPSWAGEAWTLPPASKHSGGRCCPRSSHPQRPPTARPGCACRQALLGRSAAGHFPPCTAQGARRTGRRVSASQLPRWNSTAKQPQRFERALARQQAARFSERWQWTGTESIPNVSSDWGNEEGDYVDDSYARSRGRLSPP